MGVHLIPLHAAIVEAAASRIFPTTSTPGATEAGALNYIRRLLAEAYPELAPLYRSGCRAVDRHAKRKYKKNFLRIGAAEQDAVLADFEAGRVSGFRPAVDFFEMLLSHTMEGVLGEPAYGGNRELIGWRLVGFPGHQFGYPDPYIGRRVDIEPVAVDRPYPNEEEWRAKAR
jgi:gluconate 2-dehydrogenase gamma chain